MSSVSEAVILIAGQGSRLREGYGGQGRTPKFFACSRPDVGVADCDCGSILINTGLPVGGCLANAQQPF